MLQGKKAIEAHQNETRTKETFVKCTTFFNLGKVTQLVQKYDIREIICL